jgi:hypothetical protein
LIVIAVPFVPLSTSWFEPAEYVNPDFDTFVTLPVIVAPDDVKRERLPRVNVTWPLALVVPVTVTFAAPVHRSVTVAPETGLWLASCTVTTTVAVHRDQLVSVRDPSMSPTCAETTAGAWTVHV